VSQLESHLVDALADRVLDRLRRRGPGHCLQVPHVPRDVADSACRLVDKELQQPDLARVVTAAPKRSWQATPAKAVELRNDGDHTGGRLALFVPAGEHLAAEDSFGRSTFEVLELGDLYDVVIQRLRQRLQSVAPDLAEQADSIASIVRGDARFGSGGREAAAYLARVAGRPSESELGKALAELGLLPDSEMAKQEPTEVSARLARNLEYMNTLTELAPPADRIQRLSLPVDDEVADRYKSDIARALADGTSDRRELAARFAGDSAESTVDFAPVLSASAVAAPVELAILDLGGDFVEGSDPPTIRKSDARVKVRFRCRPAPGTITGLRELRLELLRVGDRPDDLAEAGVEAVKRQASLPKRTDGTWSLRVPTEDIEPGVHRIRLQAVNEDNLVLMEALSEVFLIHEEIEEAESAVAVVPSVATACAEARGRHPELGPPGMPVISIADEGRSALDTYLIRFDGVPGRFQLPVPRLLASVERYTLADPRSLARYRISLASGEIEETLVPPEDLDLPDDFLTAREALFDEIRRNQYPVEGGESEPLVGLCNLVPLTHSLGRYVDAWARALDGAETPELLRTLLAIDQVEMSDEDLKAGVLIGPTHPLRLAWLARYQDALDRWANGPAPSEQEAAELSSLLPTLAPGNLPHVVSSERGVLRYLEPIDLSWGMWAPPSARDVNALAAAARVRLHLAREPVGAVDVGDLVGRIRRYLAAHPYVDLLKINFVQPGDASLVLRALLALQSDASTSHLRYVVRLFASELSRTDLGRGLDEFMADADTARAGRDAADAFLSSTDDPLTPKLTYSKHRVDDLLSEPENFPAHLTFFLDWFRLDAVPVPALADRRSLFADGLIVEPVRVYRAAEGDLNPQWDEHVVAPAASQDWFVRGLAACESATARLLDPEASGTVAAVRLELDRVSRSILDAVHRTSDWVVVIDPVFADDYLDSPPGPDETPRYLIDTADPGDVGFGRRIVVSTRSRDELRNLLAPIAGRYALPVPSDRLEVLLDALRALSPGLPLKLLNNRTQALEAFSLSLASLFLATQGVLRRALVVPLDIHQDLFRDAPRDSAGDVDLRRTDLAIVRLDPDRRRIEVSLVEVKARGQLPAQTPRDLIEQISGQLENSRNVLRRRLFAADLRERGDSLAGALLVRRLIRLLDGYLERAVRYGLIDQAGVPSAREFIGSLDRGYSLLFDKHALIFDLDGTSHPVERIEDVRVTRIGRDDILDVLSRTRTPVGTEYPTGETELVKTLLGTAAEADSEEVGPHEAHVSGEDTGATPPQLEDEEVGGEDDDTDEVALDEGPSRDDVLLIGATTDSRQYGVVGRVTGSLQKVAFDTDGTNVVSVFGVQGSGKSYSVGNLIEAATIREPHLNRLPHPLAAVVFHYSTDQTYVPEFASMHRPNDSVEDAHRLSVEWGAAPGRIEDATVLVPADLVEERSADYPDLDVTKLVLSPDELSVNDWRMLMGVEGGDQLYVRAMGNLFRSLRHDLSLRTLKKAISASSALNASQKRLAGTRIEFVEQFVADGARVSDLVQPGRLLIVDVRDPWLERENALALFMVMLRLCAQARTPDGRSFNKLIVFDEAHKYMASSSLVGAIVESVREMRHKGTTVVIASQDPPSLPREVLELSSVMIAHRFTSPEWLRHVAKVNEAFARSVSPAQLATLKPGEAFVWSVGGAQNFRSPQRVQMRPRLTRHGGATKRAGRE
jgi:hypothetical protein